MKWEFYSVVSDEFPVNFYDDGTNTCSSDIPTTGASHKPLQSLEPLVRDIVSVRYVLWKST